MLRGSVHRRLYVKNEIAEDKSFHYKNSQITLYDAWSKGCPNK